jgi:hypothetical protein
VQAADFFLQMLGCTQQCIFKDILFFWVPLKIAFPNGKIIFYGFKGSLFSQRSCIVPDMLQQRLKNMPHTGKKQLVFTGVIMIHHAF